MNQFTLLDRFILCLIAAGFVAGALFFISTLIR